MNLTLAQPALRAMLLAAQGLLEPPAEAPTKVAVLDTVRRMGVLQIDTIHIVARSPYLVLWSRLGDYRPAWLDELLAEGSLFEYWSHAACFLPIEDYALYRPTMFSKREPGANWHRWRSQNEAVVRQIHDHVREQGAVRSSAFARTDGKSGTWWSWKPAKMALECLFYQGELMIARRENFQRIYDLHERVLPGWSDANLPTPEAIRRTFLLRAVRALGAVPARWATDYYRQPRRRIAHELAEIARSGDLLAAKVEGWDEPVYIHPDHAELARRAADGELRPTVTTLLSPFDPVVWDRDRAVGLFDFFYRIEVYTPAAKRAYGYFTMPILHRGRLVGRLDPKAHRGKGVFEVKGIHLEPGVPITDELSGELAQAIRRCARWHSTPAVELGATEPPALADALRPYLA